MNQTALDYLDGAREEYRESRRQKARADALETALRYLWSAEVAPAAYLAAQRAKGEAVTVRDCFRVGDPIIEDLDALLESKP